DALAGGGGRGAPDRAVDVGGGEAARPDEERPVVDPHRDGTGERAADRADGRRRGQPAHLHPGDVDAGRQQLAARRRRGPRDRQAGQQRRNQDAQRSHGGVSVASALRAPPGSSVTIASTPSSASRAMRAGSSTVQATSAAPRERTQRTTERDTSEWCSVSAPERAAARRSGARTGMAERSAAAAPAASRGGQGRRETR